VVRPVEQGRREAVGVAAVGDLADELIDQVATVGEDQDAARPRGLDEADRGDGLAGAGGVLEPEAAVGARVLRRLLDDVLVGILVPVLGLLLLSGLLVLDDLLVLDVLVLVEFHVFGVRSGSVLRGVVLDLLDGRGGAVAVPRPGVAVDPLLDVGDQRGEGAREGVHLVGGELGAVREVRRLLGEQALQAEQEREVAAPLDRGGLAALVDLRERSVERSPPGSPRGEVLRLLALEQERLSGELPGSFDVGARRRLRRTGGCLGLFSHLRLFDPPLLANREDGEAHLA
jgi:hypothetical protein